MKKIALAAGALSLLAAPVVAQSLPVTAPVSGESNLEGEGSIIAALLAAGILALAVLVIADDNDGEDLPTSP
ncbi:hypothetical protein [Erythrobacter crassostreae]|uniref:Ferrochelatase n=1 Tax=Erythrobacter crassostreae TaxID=2828328 RepID=A0A9X1F1Q2_9SPHN|nr:hypothetical protein [Erythrobacter crassostrea]MBV7258691.1 hypothetical protein [Erythrobacter crassostrea]